MATPMETNTEELQEILNTVYNLPMAGGGSSEPDLVITATEDFAWAKPDNDPTSNFAKILFDPNAVISTYEKHMAGKDVRAVLRGLIFLNSSRPRMMTAYTSDRVIGYGPDVSGDNYNYLVVRFFAAPGYFFLSGDGGYYILEYRFGINPDTGEAVFAGANMWNAI